jgi:hypothetical protein
LEQVVAGGTQLHCVNNEQFIVVQFEVDDFKQVARRVWTDHQILRGFDSRVNISRRDRVSDSVKNVLVIDFVTPGLRVYLHVIIVIQ